MVQVFVQNLNLSKCSALTLSSFFIYFFSAILFFVTSEIQIHLFLQQNSHNKQTYTNFIDTDCTLTKLLHVHSKQGIAVHLSFQRQHNGRQTTKQSLLLLLLRHTFVFWEINLHWQHEDNVLCACRYFQDHSSKSRIFTDTLLYNYEAIYLAPLLSEIFLLMIKCNGFFMT